MLGIHRATLRKKLHGADLPAPKAILAARVHMAIYALTLLASLALLLAGVVMVVPALERIITQLGVISYCLPLVAIGPIIFIVLGPPTSGAPSGTAVVLAALSVFFTTLVGSILGLRSADKAALDVITVYGGTRLTQLRKVQIISALRCADGMSLCACDIAPALDVSQPTMSHHLKILTEAGILTRERKGSWAWFTLVPARLEEIAAALRVD